MAPFVLAILFTAAISEVNGAKILGLFHDISKSHSTQNRPLFKALAARGHQVTILSGFPEPKRIKNYRDIVIEGIADITENHINFQNIATSNPVRALITTFLYANTFTEFYDKAFLSNGTQTLINLNETFDLIFIDFSSAPNNLGFVHKFGNPPFIGIIPFSSNVNGDMIVGNPYNPSFLPSIFLPLSSQMSFFERFVNTIEIFVFYVYLNYFHYQNANRLMKQRFGEDVPDSFEIAKNMSLLMVNTDFAHDYPRALSPMTILVGGLHLQPAKKLPEDLKRFIDESKNGVILFSLGSLVRSDKISDEKLNAILETFRALPQRVLWKWESERIPNWPPNVMVRKWLPQNDILGDPRVRLFITHGGVNSMQEAIYHRVPMVVIPFFGDQIFQARKIEHHGIGKKIAYQTLSKETFVRAIREVLHNGTYRKNIFKMSRISRDKIKSPLETAIFWTEYVLRNGASSRLRPAGSFDSWSTFFLLDVILALGVTVLLMAFSGVFLLKNFAQRNERTELRFIRFKRLAKNVLKFVFRVFVLGASAMRRQFSAFNVGIKA